MHVHAYERGWIFFTLVLLVVLMGAIAYSAVAMGITLPGEAGLAPVVPASAGTGTADAVIEVAPGVYEARLMARTWGFEPATVEVPPGAEVTFVLTSRDVIHGFRIPGTTVNVMVVPGQVTRVTHRFNQPGEYPFWCQEYCGVGHHLMSGKLVVRPAGGSGQ